MTVVNGRNGTSSFNITSNQMASQALLPEAQSMLQGLFAANGLQFTEINMADASFKDKVVAVGKVAEIVKVNTSALKEMLKHTAALMQGQVRLAEFYAASTQIIVEGKKHIDRATANAFLTLADYQKHSTALSAKVDRKVKALDAKYELVGQLGEGKLQTSLNLIQAQKNAGEQREENTRQLQETRQQLLATAAINRQKDREFVRVGHLK